MNLFPILLSLLFLRFVYILLLSLSLHSDFRAIQEWAKIAQADGTPCILQLSHPGRMAPMLVEGLATISASAVPVQLVDTWIEKRAVKKIFGEVRAANEEDIELVKHQFLNGAMVAKASGFAGIQIHAAHGFLVRRSSALQQQYSDE